MSYTISLSISVSSDRLTGTLLDSTVYTSPVRSAVRVFTTGYKIKADNTVDSTLTMTSNTGDPATVTYWNFNIPKDGWFRFPFVIIKAAYSGGTTYAQYDAVYDSATNLVYRSKVAGNVGHSLSNVTYWELITDPSSLANNKGQSNESLNIESILYQRILTPNSAWGYGSLLASDTCCGDCDNDETLAVYDTFSLWYNGAVQADFRSELVKGEQICRRIESKFLVNCG